MNEQLRTLMRGLRDMLWLASWMAMSGLSGACTRPVGSNSDRAVERRMLFFADRKVARSEETRRVEGATWRLHRRSWSTAPPGTVTDVDAWVGPDGALHRAKWKRRGTGGTREVDLEVRGRLVQWYETGRLTHHLVLPHALAIAETLPEWHMTAPTALTLIDLSTGEWLSLEGRPDKTGGYVFSDASGTFHHIEGDGARLGPGLFRDVQARAAFEAASNERFRVHPTPFRGTSLQGYWHVQGVHGKWPNLALDGPGQRRWDQGEGVGLWCDPGIVDRAPPLSQDYLPSVGIESDAPAVHRFAYDVIADAASPAHALVEAWELARAIHARMSWSARGGPPTALATLASFVGDCDNAAVLLVAALRARGHAARAVVGYRIWEGALSPHAWVEVYAEDGWHSIDPSIPARGPLQTHVRLFEGVGSPLSMGRVLGRFQLQAVHSDHE